MTRTRSASFRCFQRAPPFVKLFLASTGRGWAMTDQRRSPSPRRSGRSRSKRPPLDSSAKASRRRTQRRTDATLDSWADGPDAIPVRHVPPPSRARADAPQDPWSKIRQEAAFRLTELDTESLAVRLRNGRHSAAPLHLRFDHVKTSSSEEIWLSLWTIRSNVFDTLKPSEPMTIHRDQLPLLDLADDDHAPRFLVWIEATPDKAAHRLQHLLRDLLNLDAAQLALDKETCTPRELERRLKTQATVRRLVERRHAGGFALRTCDRCGHPLTDATSVSLGIGPDCLKYYSREVLAAIRKGSNQSSVLASKTPVQWLTAVTAARGD